MGRSTGGVGAMAGLSEADITAWVEASCAAQGVPVKVTDPDAVRRVGVLLRTGDATGAQAKLRPVRPPPSQPPLGNDTGRIEPVHPGTLHSCMIEDCTDDGSLAIEVEFGPLGA